MKLIEIRRPEQNPKTLRITETAEAKCVCGCMGCEHGGHYAYAKAVSENGKEYHRYFYAVQEGESPPFTVGEVVPFNKDWVKSD